VGGEHIDRMKRLGFGSNNDSDDYEDAKTRVMEALRNQFRPEFLNRLDDIVMFDILSPSAIKSIVEIQVAKLKERLGTKEIDVRISSDALEYLAKEGYNPQYGARPLRRLIQEQILTSVANAMIKERMSSGGIVTVTMKNKAITVVVEKKGIKSSVKAKKEKEKAGVK
jgi:ATP-dependent Clp protease ATP-binding subunit ClpA